MEPSYEDASKSNLQRTNLFKINLRNCIPLKFYKINFFPIEAITYQPLFNIRQKPEIN